jgi:hypothetical protein
MPVRTRFVASLLFGSGFCALIYQTTWLREFRLIFGASTAASAAVVGVLIAGLGLGRRSETKARPLAFYARLELLIAASAALSSRSRPIPIGRPWRDFLPGSTPNRSTDVCSPAACFSKGSKPTTSMTARSRFFIEHLDRFLRTSNRGKRRLAICCFWPLMNR